MIQPFEAVHAQTLSITNVIAILIPNLLFWGLLAFGRRNDDLEWMTVGKFVCLWLASLILVTFLDSSFPWMSVFAAVLDAILALKVFVDFKGL